MQFDYKIVEFDKFCKNCKFRDVNENEEPCNECLTNPVNLHSIQPVKYEFDVERRKRAFTFEKLRKYTFEKVKKMTFGRLRGDKK